jgi:hypothetical protein
MAFLVVDVDPSSFPNEQITQLDGIEYLFRFMWSDRESRGYLNIYDQDENPLALGIGLKIGWPLCRRFKDPRLPPGLLICVDMSGSGLDAETADDFGSRIQLMYVTADDPSLQ